MLVNLKLQLIDVIGASLKECAVPAKDAQVIELEIPGDKQHGEFSCNTALKLGKVLRKPPVQIAQDLSRVIEQKIREGILKDQVKKVEVKNPGFINFFLTPRVFYDILYQVFNEEKNYGRLVIGHGEKIQIEFVSANPTGPLSVAHARQAAVGDALGNILNFVGFKVT